MVAAVQKYPFSCLKNTKIVIVCGPSSMDPTRLVHVDLTRWLAASRTSQLHWQPAVTCRVSPLKIISRIVPENSSLIFRTLLVVTFSFILV